MSTQERQGPMGQMIGEQDWVRESRFGRWFLGTEIWRRYVLGHALGILVRLLGESTPKGLRILDVGCGQGMAFPLLDTAFEPRSLTGVDLDGELIAKARTAVSGIRCPAEFLHASVFELPLPDAASDLVLCHQLLHHISHQAEALEECRRLLSPGGILLLAESCRSFIDSTPVRLMFRHPAEAQKTAEQYLQLVRSAGFRVDDQEVFTESPWWSQRDFGLREYLGWRQGAPQEPTEILLVGRKP